MKIALKYALTWVIAVPKQEDHRITKLSIFRVLKTRLFLMISASNIGYALFKVLYIEKGLVRVSGLYCKYTLTSFLRKHAMREYFQLLTFCNLDFLNLYTVLNCCTYSESRDYIDRPIFGSHDVSWYQFKIYSSIDWFYLIISC